MASVSENIVLVGCCGSGKSSVAQFYEDKGYTSIVASDFLRLEMQSQSTNGKVIKKYAVSGGIIPDPVVLDVILPILRERLNPPFILEGFPVNIHQLEVLDKELFGKGILNKTRFIFLDASKETVLARLSGRSTCPKCFKVYNAMSNPPKEAKKCDKCTEELFVRPLDDPEIVKKRIDLFNQTTRPMIELLKRNRRLTTIDVTLQLRLTDIEEILTKLKMHREDIETDEQ